MSNANTKIEWTDAEAAIKKAGRRTGSDSIFAIHHSDTHGFVAHAVGQAKDYSGGTLAAAIVAAVNGSNPSQEGSAMSNSVTSPWAAEPPKIVYYFRHRAAFFEGLTVDQSVLSSGTIDEPCIAHASDCNPIPFAERFHATYAAALELARKWAEDAGKKQKDVKWE